MEVQYINLFGDILTIKPIEGSNRVDIVLTTKHNRVIFKQDNWPISTVFLMANARYIGTNIWRKVY